MIASYADLAPLSTATSSPGAIGANKWHHNIAVSGFNVASCGDSGLKPAARQSEFYLGEHRSIYRLRHCGTLVLSTAFLYEGLLSAPGRSITVNLWQHYDTAFFDYRPHKQILLLSISNTSLFLPLYRYHYLICVLSNVTIIRVSVYLNETRAI